MRRYLIAYCLCLQLICNIRAQDWYVQDSASLFIVQGSIFISEDAALLYNNNVLAEADLLVADSNSLYVVPGTAIYGKICYLSIKQSNAALKINASSKPIRSGETAVNTATPYKSKPSAKGFVHSTLQPYPFPFPAFPQDAYTQGDAVGMLSSTKIWHDCACFRYEQNWSLSRRTAPGFCYLFHFYGAAYYSIDFIRPPPTLCCYDLLAAMPSIKRL